MRSLGKNALCITISHGRSLWDNHALSSPSFIMHLQSYVPSLLLSAATLVASLPADNAAAGLRLIKTSEEDPGTWVSSEAKISEYLAKDIHFVDITDITDPDVLQRLSTKPSVNDAAARKAIDYPTVLSHEAEAKALIEDVSTSGPEGWLKTMTE